MTAEDKNFNVEESWSGAEKMLDKHFRKRRILIWGFSLAIPAIIAGLALILNDGGSNEKILPVNQGAEAHISPSVSESAITTKSENISVESNLNIGKAVNADDNRPVNTPSATSSVALMNADPVSKKPDQDGSNGSLNSPDGVIVFSETNKTDGKQIDSDIALSRVNVSAIPSLTGYTLADEIPGEDMLRQNVPAKKCFLDVQVGWEVSVYGGAMYHQKTLSAETDWENYLQHRKNEEDPVFMPAVGIALSANWNSLSLSLGAEYTMYGEKTDYYPYSFQPELVNNGQWNLFMTSYTDIDTAFIMGNQLLISTIRQRPDSSFVVTTDTVFNYAYDEQIAKNNGVNQIHYIELPIEVSYSVTRGRAGLGFSAGIAPAFLVGKSGHYISKDGKGLESFDDMDYFRDFTVNGRISADFFYRMGARTKLVLRPQLRGNLNSIFTDDSGINQRYYSTGVLFGVSYMLN